MQPSHKQQHDTSFLKDSYWFPWQQGATSPMLSESRFPSSLDLRDRECFPSLPVSNQKNEGSCVVHSINAGLVCAHRKAGIPAEAIARVPVRQTFYQVFKQAGYSSPELGISFERALAALRAAGKIDYAYRLGVNVDNFKACLSNGHAIVFGCHMSRSMANHIDTRLRYFFQGRTSTAKIPLFNPNESSGGYHAFCCLGYDDAEAAFLVQNSWGESWGQEGLGWFPYANCHPKCVKDAFFMVMRSKS